MEPKYKTLITIGAITGGVGLLYLLNRRDKVRESRDKSIIEELMNEFEPFSEPFNTHYRNSTSQQMEQRQKP